MLRNILKRILNKSGMTGWGYATRIAPQNSTNGTIMFWDVYDNLTNVMKTHGWRCSS